MSMESIFTKMKSYIGIDEKGTGNTKEDIDALFTDPNLDTGYVCYICGYTAHYQLVAKKDILNSVELSKHGQVCKNCIQSNPVDTREYGLKQIEDVKIPL